MKSIIVGMGIGQLYQSVLFNWRSDVEIITVDNKKPAVCRSIAEAIEKYGHFDTAHICTPNFLHEPMARELIPVTDMVFIEKPGVASAEHLKQLKNDYPAAKFMMVKNNQYREDFSLYAGLKNISNTIRINWINHDRIPSPGSWFTNKELSYGGVSRDLLPHALSYVTGLFYDYQDCKIKNYEKKQNWSLKDISNTDYGTVDLNGVYDVDDYVELELEIKNKTILITCDWRGLQETDISISFDENKINLDLCPESAYNMMIQTATHHKENTAWWQDQYEQDYWIHSLL